MYIHFNHERIKTHLIIQILYIYIYIHTYIHTSIYTSFMDG